MVRLSKGNERIFYRRYFEANPDEKIDYLQVLYPDQIFSFKKHVCNDRGVIPEGCRILSCHGKPRLHRITNQHVKRHWR